MSTFTETKVLQSLEIFPALNVINVKYQNTTLKDGVKFMEQTEAKSYSTSQFSDFKIEVAPTGGTLAEIVAGFSQAALDAASEVPATLAEKEAEKTALEAAHSAALAAKDSELAAANAAHAAEITALESATTTAFAAKDAAISALEAKATAAHTTALATIATLQAQVEALTPAEADVPAITSLQAKSLVRALGSTLGITAAQVDALFVEAEKPEQQEVTTP